MQACMCHFVTSEGNPMRGSQFFKKIIFCLYLKILFLLVTDSWFPGTTRQEIEKDGQCMKVESEFCRAELVPWCWCQNGYVTSSATVVRFIYFL